MQVKYDCPEHGWEDYDVGAAGFLVLVVPRDPPEDTESKVVGLTPHEYVEVHWSDGDQIHGITFGDVPERVGASQNGQGPEDDVIVNIGVEPGPSDEELDAWLDARFGVEEAAMKPYKPRVGHKFNLAFARDLIAFGRSFT